MIVVLLRFSFVPAFVLRFAFFPGLAITNFLIGIASSVAWECCDPLAIGGVGLVMVLVFLSWMVNFVVFFLWWLYLVMSRAVNVLLSALKLNLPPAVLTNLVIWCLVIVMVLLSGWLTC